MSFGNVLGQQIDLSQYATESEVDSKISTAATNYVQQELIGSWNGIDASTGVSVDYDFTHRLPIAFKITLKCGLTSSIPGIIYTDKKGYTISSFKCWKNIYKSPVILFSSYILL